MSGGRRPVVKVTYSVKEGETWRNYSVASVWPKDHAGLYKLSLDKGSERYPALGFLEALKAFATGRGQIEFSVESQREQRGGSIPQPPPSSGGDGFGDDLPF